MIHRIFLLSKLSCLSLLLFVGCAGSGTVLNNPTTSAILWVQNAAEYQALTRQVYQTASANLGLALEDSYSTALPEQKEGYQSLPPAIILDVDETVLDNSPFQARMIKQHSSYSPEAWNLWVKEAQAEPIAGAVVFTQLAAKHGVTVFYVTNREASVEQATRENLQKFGFPLSSKTDVILSKDERKGWTSAKVNRRAFIAKNYRVIMLFGDDLNDFVSAKNISMKARDELVKKYARNWGRSWYILPNPVYGSWEQALYNFDHSLSSKAIEKAKEAHLDAKQKN